MLRQHRQSHLQNIRTRRKTRSALDYAVLDAPLEIISETQELANKKLFSLNRCKKSVG
jgi:hypothetical protein